MYKLPKIRSHDPAIRELMRLVELPAFAECPKEIQDGVRKSLELSAQRDCFCEEVSSKSATLERLQEFTLNHDWKAAHEAGKTSFCLSPRMMSGALEGQFLKMLVSMQRPRRVLELGMYTGCGAVAMSEALPADGVLITIDREPYLKEVAQDFYGSFPEGSKIQVKIGAVKEVMRGLLGEGQQFDLIFCDADKPGYVEYYKIAMDEGLLAPGGSFIADNAFFGGSSYLGNKDHDTNPIGAFLDKVKSDSRVESVLVPIRDGVLIVRRKEDIGQ